MEKLPILDVPDRDTPCCTQCSQTGDYIAFHVPNFPSGEIILLSSAVTGGIFRQYLGDAAAENGCIGLILAPLHHRFSLPGYPGTEISWDELFAVKSRESFEYSPHLCCNYIYIQQEHAVILFDDDESLQQKADLAKKLNVPYLIASPEILQKIRLPE